MSDSRLIRKLAVIDKASIGMMNDSKFLSFSISVGYESGTCQSIGNIALDTYSKVNERRVGTAYGCDMIIQLLNTLNVCDISEAQGRIIYIWGEGDGFSFNPKGIQSLWIDGGKKLIFDEVLKQHKELLR